MYKNLIFKITYIGTDEAKHSNYSLYIGAPITLELNISNIWTNIIYFNRSLGGKYKMVVIR